MGHFVLFISLLEKVIIWMASLPAKSIVHHNKKYLLNLFELKLVCAICKILFWHKNEMLQMGKHNKIVGYLRDIQ